MLLNGYNIATLPYLANTEALENRPSERKQNRQFLACLLYHNLTIYTTATKSSSPLPN